MKGNLKPPEISDKDRSPIVEQLLAFIDHQSTIIQQQVEQIQLLKDEIARLKNQPPRPTIKPSSLGKSNRSNAGSTRNKRPGSKKRSKTAKLTIHKTEPIEPESIPAGSQFRYYKDFVVQDITIEPYNTRFRLKVYETPDGGYVSGKLPANVNGKHFGPTLAEFVLYQYYHCHVTQPLLLEQLDEFGIDISTGQLNNLLIEEKTVGHEVIVNPPFGSAKSFPVSNANGIGQFTINMREP